MVAKGVGCERMGEKGEGEQEVQTSSYKINKPWRDTQLARVLS